MDSKKDSETGSKGGKIPSSNKDHQTATLHQVFSSAEAYDIFFMVIGTFGSFISGASIPAFNYLFGRMIDTLNKDPSGFSKEVNQICIDYIIVAAVNVAGGFLQIYFWTLTGERQTQKFRERYVNAILSQEIGWFDNCGANELATKVAELIGKVNDGTGRKYGDLLQYLVQVLAAFGVAFYLCWQLTVVMLAALPMIALSTTYLIRSVTAAHNRSLQQYSLAGGLATQTINSIRTITALNMQPMVINQYRKYLFEAMRHGVQKGFDIGAGNGALFGTIFWTYCLGYWYGGKLVADDIENGCTNDCITGGKIVACFFCIVLGSFGVGQIAPPLTSFISAKAAVAKVFEVLDRKPLIDGLSDTGDRPAIKVTGDIELKDLQFAYPARPNITVCRDYNLHIKSGETVALVGASGSGKSTIINLLLRFYDPQQGAILLDGYDIKQLNVKWLRSHIGYVGQEPVLFAGTIGDNIAFGLNSEEDNRVENHMSITEEAEIEKEREWTEQLQEKIIAAAKAANAHEFISSFPKGYDTDVGSNGVAMSGGQKQRIAIARALIKKPAVLLLDEATSALDAASERIVQQSIDALAESKAQTTIIIAHRLSTIRNADKIVVVDAGQIVEIGSHDELLALNPPGLYAQLWNKQNEHS